MSTAILNPFCPDISFPLKDRFSHTMSLPRKSSSLERACWLYGVTGNTVLVLPFLALLFVLTPNPGLMTMMHAYFAGIVAYTIWAFSRIWTSASQHDGDPRLALCARLYVVIGGIQLAIYSAYVIYFNAYPTL